MKKNAIHPWIVDTWGIPPHADADCVWRLEDVMHTDQLPSDPRAPAGCFDEACTQGCGEVRPSPRPRPGQPARVDDAYARQGVCHQWMMGEPLRGWRHGKGTARRTRQDDARCVRAFIGPSPSLWLGRNFGNFTRQSKIDGPLDADKIARAVPRGTKLARFPAMLPEFFMKLLTAKARR